MDAQHYNLHLIVGFLCGKGLTHDGKSTYITYEDAKTAAEKHNVRKNKRHDVEGYPCAFCHHYHIGRIMSDVELQGIVNQENWKKPLGAVCLSPMIGGNAALV